MDSDVVVIGDGRVLLVMVGGGGGDLSPGQTFVVTF